MQNFGAVMAERNLAGPRPKPAQCQAFLRRLYRNPPVANATGPGRSCVHGGLDSGITLCGSAASGPIVEPAINCWRQIIFFCSPTNQRDRFRARLGSRAADIAVPIERPLSARPRPWCTNQRMTAIHPLRTLNVDTFFLKLGCGFTCTPAPRREAGRARSREGPSGAPRCLDALYRDGAEPRH
jgi:hypothetical protein